MRAAPAKFLFENDFAPGGGERKPLMTLDDHAAKLKAAEAAAFARGFAQGAKPPRPSSVRSPSIDRIAAAMSALDQQLEAVEAKFETEAVEVAVAVAKKLAPELVAQRAVRGDRGARHRLLPQPGEMPACGGARERRAARDRAREARRDRAPLQPRHQAGAAGRAGDRARRLPHRMGGRRHRPRHRRDRAPRSTKRWRATSMHGEAARTRTARARRTSGGGKR